MSTRNVGSGQVPERWDPGEYQKGGIRASIRKVGSGQVPKNGGIRESTGNVGFG